MKINQLKSTGLKSGDFTHDLHAVNLIVGGNFQGKTSRLEAIRLALVGYLPELGKTNAATMQLARNGHVTVQAIFDNDDMIGRAWKRERGAIRCECARTDETMIVPDVMLDPSVYFSLGDKDRIRYVFNRAKVDLAEFAADSIISNIKRIKLEDHNEQHEAAIDALVSMVDESDRERHENDQSIQEWIEKLIADIRERFKLAKQNADRMSKTVQGLTAIQATEDEADIANVERDIAGLRSQLFVLGTQRSSVSDLIASAKKNDLARSEIEAELKRRTDGSEAIAQAERELEEVNAGIGGYKSETDTISGQVWSLKSEWQQAQSNVARIADEIAKRTGKHDKDMASPCCPYCKSKKQGWQDELVSDYEIFLVEQRAKQSAETSRVAWFAEQLQALDITLAQSKKKDAEHNARFQRSRELSANLNQLRNNQRQHDVLTARLAALPPASTPETVSDLAAQLTQIDSKRVEIDTKLKSLDERQKAYLAARHDQKRNAQAILEHQKVACEVVVTRQALDLLETLQGQMVEQAFKTIIERANRVTSGILKADLEYRDGEIGMFSGTTWIGHRTFSGTEKALAYAGISVALAADSPIKLVLIDELARLDGENMEKLLQRMVELTDAGEIDQFIGVSAQIAGTLPKQVNVIAI